jgi:hypothetical protein
MSTPVVAPEVAQFVSAVRVALDDLDPEVVEELAGGLAADLTDSLEGGGPPAGGWGDSAAYAAELRSAAGLPPRAAARGRLSTLGPAALAGALATRAARLGERITRHPRWPAVRDFVEVLRPVWWVARAWVVYVVLADTMFQAWQGQYPVPTDLLPLLLLLALVILSVQGGRRSVSGTLGRWRWPVAAVNLLAALLFPFMVGDVAREVGYQTDYVSTELVSTDGLYSNGNPVTNVLPYDSAGRPLTDVQLFDQNGAPLGVAPNTGNNTVQNNDGGSEGLPLVDANGESRWNVFPLRQRPLDPARSVPTIPSVAPLPVPSAD